MKKILLVIVSGLALSASGQRLLGGPMVVLAGDHTTSNVLMDNKNALIEGSSAMLYSREDQSSLLMLSTIVQSGTLGTVNWTLDDQGVLTFGGGDMFYSASNSSPLSVSNEVTAVEFTAPVQARNVDNLFYNFVNMTTINGLVYLDTSNATDMSNMFAGTSKLTYLDVSSFDTSKVTSMSGMFQGASSLTSLDVSNFDTSKVTSMNRMFSGISRVINLDLTNFDTSKVTSMSNMFADSSRLTTLNISNFDTSKVTSMNNMFANISRLITLDVSGFNTSNVTTMSGMFAGTSNLTSLDLSSFDTSKVTSMVRMFSGASKLSTLDVSNFDMSNVMNMSQMFNNMSNLHELHLGVNFRFVGGTAAALPNVSNNLTDGLIDGDTMAGSYYSGYWVNLGTGRGGPSAGSVVMRSIDLMNTYDGTTMADTYVWQAAYITRYSVDGIITNSAILQPKTHLPIPAVPTKIGYIFTGWNTAQDGSGADWDFMVDIMPANDLTVYAQFSKEQTTSDNNTGDNDVSNNTVDNDIINQLSNTGGYTTEFLVAGGVISMAGTVFAILGRKVHRK